MIHTNILYALFLAASAWTVHSYLVTRFKNPNEYVAKDDLSMLDDLDEDTYQYLINELPQFKKYIRRKNPGNLYEQYDNDDNVKHDQYQYDYDPKDEWSNANFEEEDLKIQNRNISSTTLKPKLPFVTRWPQPRSKNSTGKNETRKFLDTILSFFNPYRGKLVAKCYWCGLNTSGIPLSPLCHDMFETQDHRARRNTRFFRSHCHYNKFYSYASRKKPWRSYWGGPVYEKGRGLISQHYGAFLGGCFKRFMDVGTVYTQRGCKTWWPRLHFHYSGIVATSSARSFAAHRFAALERPLKHYKKDICIISPHASLTPFHRSISLYVRYHVCVCYKYWCNKAGLFSSSYFLIIFNIAFVIIYYLVVYLTLSFRRFP